MNGKNIFQAGFRMCPRGFRLFNEHKRLSNGSVIFRLKSSRGLAHPQTVPIHR